MMFSEALNIFELYTAPPKTDFELKNEKYTPINNPILWPRYSSTQKNIGKKKWTRWLRFDDIEVYTHLFWSSSF